MCGEEAISQKHQKAQRTTPVTQSSHKPEAGIAHRKWCTPVNLALVILLQMTYKPEKHLDN